MMHDNDTTINIERQREREERGEETDANDDVMQQSKIKRDNY